MDMREGDSGFLKGDDIGGGGIEKGAGFEALLIAAGTGMDGVD